jgi:LPXTG-site transpeptidase (sortase) family protein
VIGRSWVVAAGNLLVGVSVAGLVTLAPGVVGDAAGALRAGAPGKAAAALSAFAAHGGALTGESWSSQVPSGPPEPFRPITRVEIPARALRADVVPAALVVRDAGLTWEVPAFAAGHAERTAGAGARGNAVLVGHVTSPESGSVFRPLDRVAPDDRVRVYSGDAAFDYQVTDVRTVARTDVSVVAPAGGATLSLITCTGPWLPAVGDYAQRLVVRAELVEHAVALAPGGAAPPPLSQGLRTVYDVRPGPGVTGWSEDAEGLTRVTPEGYRLTARRPGEFVLRATPVTAPLRDAVVTGDFRKVGGPAGGGYGLVVRDQGSGQGPAEGHDQRGRFYVLAASDRGEVGVWRRDGDRWIVLLPWTPAAAVLPGSEVNELSVQTRGDGLTFAVNGTAVAAVDGALLDAGAVGIFVGGDQNEVVLDRFAVQVPG